MTSTSGRRRTGKRNSKTRRTSRGRRAGALRRRLFGVVSILCLVVSMTVSVRRTAEGRRLSETISDMDREERLLRAQLADEIVRVESLESRPRVLGAASDLGLYPAEDTQVTYLEDPR